jgi:hypothetical protein
MSSPVMRVPLRNAAAVTRRRSLNGRDNRRQIRFGDLADTDLQGVSADTRAARQNQQGSPKREARFAPGHASPWRKVSV